MLQFPTKYPRTYHLPYSPGATNDDKILKEIGHLLNIPLTITEKIDGSNVCLTKENCFARSHSGPPTHSSFDAFKALHASIKSLIPDDIFLYGEWCFAKHSIFYDKLPAYLLLFGVRDSKIGWSSWSGVELWANRLSIQTVPVIEDNIIFNTEDELKTFVIKESKKISICGPTREGLVLRKRSKFSDDDFTKSVVKYVRANHVETDKHWKFQKIIRNRTLHDS